MNEVSSAIVKAYAIARSRWDATGTDGNYLNEMNRLRNAASVLWPGHGVDLDQAADAFIAENRD
jgi:hypothetical protein